MRIRFPPAKAPEGAIWETSAVEPPDKESLPRDTGQGGCRTHPKPVDRLIRVAQEITISLFSAPSPRRFGHNLGTNENGFRILLIRKPDTWCGEGDLNPHEIAPASTSSQNFLFQRVSYTLNSLILRIGCIVLFRRVSRNHYSSATFHDSRASLQKLSGIGQILGVNNIVAALHAVSLVA